MKKRLLSILIFFCAINLFAQEESKNRNYADVKLYIPSVFGIVAGNNAKLALRKDYSSVNYCFNTMVEARISLFYAEESGRVSFSFAVGGGFYFEFGNSEDDIYSINLSLGGGIHINTFEFPFSPMSGICFYFYPAYQIPVYVHHYEPYLKWKSALDIGYNFKIKNHITIYPFTRNIFGWNSKDFRYGFDLGIAIGIYFHDRNYYYF